MVKMCLSYKHLLIRQQTGMDFANIKLNITKLR